MGNQVYWHDAGDHNEYLTTCIDIKNYEKKNNIILGSIEYESIKNKFLKKSKFKKIYLLIIFIIKVLKF